MARGHFFFALPLAGALTLLAFTPASNAAPSDVYVPEELAPWVDWILHDREYLDCPFYFIRYQSERDAFICTWPGALRLEVDETGARFSQPWAVYGGDQWLPLPGDGNVWPEQVTANGQETEVLLEGNAPGVRLAPGRYTISGRFGWTERPRELKVPPQTGLLALSIDGSPVVRPERSRDSVWLAPREAEARAEDRIDVQVYRLVADDVPTRLTTVFTIDVAGSVREVLLAPALPDGFVPLALDSALPARLESDGQLRLQVKPGRFDVRLLARGSGVLDEVALPSPASHLPDAEIWSYRSNDRLRVTVPEGLVPVDPEQVSAPDDWLELPAFRVEPGERLRIVEQSRGMPSTDNQLTLNRELWMDFDGGGFVFGDSISGSMQSGWRLDVVEPYVLLAASEGDDNLLVTLGARDGMTGVELRERDVYLEGIGRSASRGRLPVSGWQTRFDAVEATLNLPPGNKLFAAIGADRAPGSWVERWKLLDFFLVLIITIATTRLFGKSAGAVAFFALALSWQESDAPQWIWLNLLAAIALVRVAPEGRLRKSAIAYRAVSLAALVLILVPFFAEQLRIGVYPQLEPQSAHSYGYGRQPVSAPAPADDGFGAMESRERALKEAAPTSAVEEIVVTGAQAKRSYARYAPNAIVQAGPGIPSWSWNSYSLSFSGPVDAERTFRLMVVPRWFVTILRFAGVFLLLAFAGIVASEVSNRRWNRRAAWRKETRVPSILLVSLVAGGALVASPDGRAQTPAPEILQQLEQRLLEPPPCAPRCAEIVSAEVVIADDAMSVVLTVHALEDVAVPLPGSPEGWRPENVELDGIPSQVYRRTDQTLWIHAAAGSHRVTLRGPLPPVDSLEVPFPLPPRIIAAESRDWVVGGIRERRLPSGSLQLARRQAAGSEDAPARRESARFPLFVRVERTISLDLDWRVGTRVVRVAPKEGALSLDVPLLDGEAIVSGDFQVRDGAVLVSMNPGQHAVSWESTLPRTSPLLLRARADTASKEVWRVGAGRIWQVSFDGVPESQSDAASDGGRVAEFYPRSGESLTIDAERPDASSGTTLAFDRVRLESEIAARSRTVQMSLEYRSTRGAQHAIRLPDDAEVLSVTIDGRNEPLSAGHGELSLPILPGEHDIDVRWRQNAPQGLRVGTPVVDLAAPSSNIELGLQLPQSRWILFTRGPRLGPAVMYWSELAVLLLVALVLGRIGLTPLRTRDWLLLGLGFSTFSWAALVLVAAWLVVAGAKARWPGTTSWWRFNLVQLSVAAMTIAALAAIVVAVPAGLLGTPDMHIAGNGSRGNSLQWFADRSDSVLPGTGAVSLPLWAYKLLVLGWALWLSFALLRWLPWVWRCFVSQGLWRPRRQPEDAPHKA
jgi:hypothetical protein